MRRAARVNMPLGRPLKLQQLKLKFAPDTGCCCCCYSRQSGLTVAMAAAKSSRKRQHDSAGEREREWEWEREARKPHSCAFFLWYSNEFLNI